MRLRLDERQQVLKVTHPRGIGHSAALAWAVSQKPWVTKQLDSALPPEPLVPGSVIPIDGVETELVWESSWPRTPQLHHGKLVCGGPESAFPRRIEQFLKRLALERLSAETTEIANRAGVKPSSIRVGDARTRWGSCSSSGAIRYSWRLILASAQARRFVVAHEVAHLKHLNHSSDFKLLERELFDGDVAAAEKLLREAGPRLRRVGLAA